VFTPVLAKHTKSFNLIDTLAVGVDRIQRSFEPMRRQVESWRQTQLSDDTAKLILYRAFVEGELEAPKSLLSPVHRLYFEPQYEEFSPRTMWSLSNAFTSAFKELVGFFAMQQTSFAQFTGFRIHEGNLLEARMIVTPYNQHVRLLSSEPFGWFAPPKSTRPWEPTLLWNHYQQPGCDRANA
jgi:hypothetical protein